MTAFTTRRLRTPLLTLCVMAVLAVPGFAADEVSSGDNDGGWGLPGPASESNAADQTVEFFGEQLQGVLNAAKGTLEVQHKDAPETLASTTDELDDAQVVATSMVRWDKTVDGSLKLQGEGQLVLDDSLEVSVQAPKVALYKLAFLLVDEGAGSARALLDEPAAAATVSHSIVLGAVHEVDVQKLSNLIALHADALADDDPATAPPALSLLVVSVDPGGFLRTTLVRAEADGGLEFVLR